MDGALLQLLRHKTWSTLNLIEHCGGLETAHLDATMPGTYGTIPATLRHLVSSDEHYLAQLTGTGVPEPLPERLPQRSDLLNLLAERFRRSAPRWERLAENADVSTREITAPDGWRFPGAVLLAQAIHHADDHRTQILSILGARGVEVPRLSVWGYAASHGLLREPPATGAST